MKLKEEGVHGASLEWSKQRLSAFSNKALSIKREHVKKSECDHCFFFLLIEILFSFFCMILAI